MAKSSIIFENFQPVYRYKVKNGRPVNKEVIDHDLWGARGVVYARVHGKSVVYIGKTDGSLRGRIRTHLRGFPHAKQGMSPHYRKWAEGKTITIFAHKPEPITYLGLSVPIHTGLEYALIERVEPKFVARK